MILADALLNAKKYIKEPKYQPKEKMWAYNVYKNGRWTEYFCLSEEACWKAYYVEFGRIKELLLADEKVR